MTTLTTAAIDADRLRPFSSFLVLECTATDADISTTALMRFVRQHLARARADVTIIASGIAQGDSLTADENAPFDYVDGLLYRRATVPGWSVKDAPYLDVHHEIVVIARRRRLLAVHGPANLREAILKWLDREPYPPVRRVPRPILQGAFLRGQAKGLWLNGTHPRRATKPDSKNLSGPNLGSALNPFDDSTFALGSARAAVPDDGSFSTIEGVVGATPRNALVWNGPTDSFTRFVAVLREALDIIGATMDANAGVEHPYPLLAAEIDDLSEVAGAYEVAITAPDDVAGPDVAQDVLDAAAVLDRALLSVRPGGSGPNFVMDVGVNGSTAGAVACSVQRDRGRVVLRFGLAGEPTDPIAVRQILDALSFVDLVAIYYLSGHQVHGGAIYLPTIRNAPFPKWSFEDFSGYELMREKVSDKYAEIHRDTGTPSDTSLFGWVVQRYAASGWLTCDDGPGEVADFVHLDPGSGELWLIHVKGAKTDVPGRQVSASAYEVVAAQATKNLQFLNTNALVERLASPLHKTRATWYDGVRQPDRSGILAALSTRSRIALAQVVIVQPHLRKDRYDTLATRPNNSAREDATRLERLETLLNSARSSATGVGAELVVVGSA